MKRREEKKERLRERIVAWASDAFLSQGIRSVRMDDVAVGIGISKRTLYETFADKEALIEACLRKIRADREQYFLEIQSGSAHVMDTLLHILQKFIEDYLNTDKRFFEDLKKYPLMNEMLKRRNDKELENAVDFFKQGVEQGYFRDDINFYITHRLLEVQCNQLIDSEEFRHFPQLEVLEQIFFVYLRGVSTPKGAEVLEQFIRDYRISFPDKNQVRREP